MAETKVLGKISDVEFGIGGYQDSQIGLHLSFSFGAGGVRDSIGTWDPTMIECTKHCKWTEEDRTNNLANVMRKLSLYLSQAKVGAVDELKGIPVEITLNGTLLVSWRILTEVL